MYETTLCMVHIWIFKNWVWHFSLWYYLIATNKRRATYFPDELAKATWIITYADSDQRGRLTATAKIRKRLRDLRILYYFYTKKINFKCLTCDHKLWTSIPSAHMSHMTSGLCQVRQVRFPGSPSFSSSRLPSISQGSQRTRGQSFWEKKIRAWGNTRGNTKVTKVIQIGKNSNVTKRRSPKGKRN